MTTIKMQGNANGSGNVTLTAPNTNSARTVTLPDEDIDLGNIGGGPAVVGTLNGTGTIALQNSKGVSSVSDLGTGKYNFNFSTNFSTATYYANNSACYHTSAYWAYLGSQFNGGQSNTRTTSNCLASTYTGGYRDAPSVGLLASE